MVRITLTIGRDVSGGGNAYTAGTDNNKHIECRSNDSQFSEHLFPENPGTDDTSK